MDNDIYAEVDEFMVRFFGENIQKLNKMPKAELMELFLDIAARFVFTASANIKKEHREESVKNFCDDMKTHVLENFKAFDAQYQEEKKSEVETNG